MAGPWEQYQSAPASDAPPAAGPWTQYGSQSGGEHGYAYAPPETKPPADAPVTTVGDGKTLADVISSPDAQAADIPQSQTPTPPAPSLTDLRDRIQQGDISVLKRLAPGPEAQFPERLVRGAAMVGVHGLASLAEMPLNALIGLGQGPGGLTLNPNTGTFGLTPEAASVVPFFATPFGGPRVNPLTPTPGATAEPHAAAAPTPSNQLMQPGPAFVPPGTPAPMLPRILDLVRADQQVAQNKPAFVPPSTSTSVTGEVAPIQQPPNPIDQPGVPRVAPAAQVEPQPPGAVGAAPTPAAVAAMSPQDVAINRSQAENTKLLEQQQPGVQDLNQYVDGSNPTVAQIEQTVNAAREDKTLRNLNTDVSQESREVADRNNTARQIHYADNAGSQFDVAAASKARDDQLNTDMTAAFRRKGEADAQPIVDVGQSILDGPDGKVDPVVRVVNNVMGKLYDKDGNLETDPEMLWGVRKQINLLLSKEAAIENPTNQAAARQLMQMRNAVDAAIEPAAPGFGNAIANYAAASRPIDAMELLQAREPKLYDAQNRMQYSKVQQMMREAVAARHPDAPLNPWQSLSDDQMSRLWALRDDLRRSASAEDLARASGSDSVPNMIDVAKQYAGVGLSAVPVLGPATFRIKAALGPIMDARAARQQRTRGMQMLYPDPDKYQMRNILGP
jgi:hypothetical protein